MSKKNIDKEKILQFIKNNHKNLNQKQIADMFRVSPSTVFCIIQKEKNREHNEKYFVVEHKGNWLL